MGFSYRPLWVLLAKHDMSKTEYREAVGIGTVQLAKMGKNENVSMDVIERTCAYFNVQPNDVIEYIAKENEQDEG